MIGQLRRAWKAVLLVLLVDPKWYRSQYSDVRQSGMSPRWHFALHGRRERRSPDQGVSTGDVLRPARMPYHRPRLRTRYRESQRARLASILASKKPETLLVFFNVATTQLSGGMLSINRFAGLARDLTQADSETQVVMSTVPLAYPTVDYELFSANIEPVHFSVVAEGTSPRTVVLFLPEHYVVDFCYGLSDAERAWLAARRVKVVILDQNNTLMPPPLTLAHALQRITVDVTIASAHETYTTQELANRFSYPVKKLTPLLPEPEVRTLEQKKPVIMVSPDDPVGDDGTLRKRFLDELAELVPEAEIVTVERMTLADYLELASSCRLSITFGEGLDGYFIEPVLAGGVSLALANQAFFPASFDGSFAIAPTLDGLRDKAAELWNTYGHMPERYSADNRVLSGLLAELYSREKTLSELHDLLEGKADFHPQPATAAPLLFENLRTFLASERGFKFADPQASTALAISPDNDVIEHFAGEFYSVLYEIYFSRDYDSLLRSHGRPTVLFDVGTNVGTASVYLARGNTDIEAIYAFEPIASVARVARRNIERNILNVPVTLKDLALSDRFAIEQAELIDGWTTAFSVDDPVLNSQLKIDHDGARHESFTIEVEVVPASREFAAVMSTHPDCRFVMKCDVQGSEFQIIGDLERAGLLGRLDAVVIESHFRSPAPIVESLERSGFSVSTRLDSEANNVYLIVADRT